MKHIVQKLKATKEQYLLKDKTMRVAAWGFLQWEKLVTTAGSMFHAPPPVQQRDSLRLQVYRPCVELLMDSKSRDARSLNMKHLTDFYHLMLKDKHNCLLFCLNADPAFTLFFFPFIFFLCTLK